MNVIIALKGSHFWFFFFFNYLDPILIYISLWIDCLFEIRKIAVCLFWISCQVTTGSLMRLLSQGRKKHMAWPGLEPRTSRRPCEHSDHRATDPRGRPVTISPCLIRFVPESARNHAGTDETVPMLLAARARTHTEPPNVKGEEKAHGPTGTRTQDLSQTVRAFWPLSYRATRSTCDNLLAGTTLYDPSSFLWTFSLLLKELFVIFICVVRPSTFSNDISSEAMKSILTIFHI